MKPTRRLLIYGLLLGVWLLVVGWQVEEHVRIRTPPRPICGTAPRKSPTP